MLVSVAYLGTDFSGFARQPTARTVAGELDGAVRAVDERASLVRGVSRTDAGVHARDQRVAFDACLDIPPRGWALALARHLPSSIAIWRAATVPAGYDPRAHATGKVYRYAIHQGPVRDPFLDDRAWRIDERLNHAGLRAEAQALVGEHDFAAFRSSSDERSDTRRVLTRLDLHENPEDSRQLAIEVEGRAFMHNMVRIIVGTLVDVARGRLAPGACSRALASRDRRDLGITAPAHGLCLDRVRLDVEGEDAWP